jgi:acetylglutamate kinase
MTIKLGGVAGAHAATLALLAERAEPGWVLIHGGGAEVAAWSRRQGLEPTTLDGLRVTDAATLEVVVAVLRGLVNARLVAELVAAGVAAVGLGGADGDLLIAERYDDRLGAVGSNTRVDTSMLETLAGAGMVPVVAPIAREAGGAGLLNVNADEVAAAIAAARGGRLLLLTDVAGVLRDDAVVARLTVESAEAMLADASAHGGMVPKLRAAVAAARAGCEVGILDGTSPDAVGAALDGDDRAGTVVTATSAVHAAR